MRRRRAQSFITCSSSFIEFCLSLSAKQSQTNRLCHTSYTNHTRLLGSNYPKVRRRQTAFTTTQLLHHRFTPRHHHPRHPPASSSDKLAGCRPRARMVPDASTERRDSWVHSRLQPGRLAPAPSSQPALPGSAYRLRRTTPSQPQIGRCPLAEEEGNGAP